VNGHLSIVRFGDDRPQGVWILDTGNFNTKVGSVGESGRAGYDVVETSAQMARERR
jgi:hypothetical protein